MLLINSALILHYGTHVGQTARVTRREMAAKRRNNGPRDGQDPWVLGRDGDSERMLRRLRGHVEPAFAFAVSYLRLLSEEMGLGALAVWFGAEGIERYLADDTRDLEWRDELADLLRSATPLGPSGQSAFCAELRRHPEGDRRCHECDARWISRVRKYGRSWVYQCHAGLSEVIAPIVVNGKRVGEVMGGQIASAERLPNGFDDIWGRVQDIEGVERAVLARVFARVRVVDERTLAGIQSRLRAAARGLGALIESIAGLMSREALLGRVRSHLERDFAWFALTSPDAAEEDVAARAKALGFSQPPSAVIVIARDRTSRAGFGHAGRESAAMPPVLFETAQRLLNDVPNTIVCSIRPEEVLVLLSPGRSRNPALRRLYVEDIMTRLTQELRRADAGPLLIGMCDGGAPGARLARTYEEALADLGRNVLSLVESDPEAEISLGRLLQRMTLLDEEVRQAVRERARPALESAVEAQLRLAAGCPGSDGGARLSLFTHMTMNLLSVLRTVARDQDGIDRAGARYGKAMSTLRTAQDMTTWFHANLLPLLDAAFGEPESPRDRTIAAACSLAARRLSEPITREQLAAELGVSSTHFGKMFRMATGMTFREFLSRVRARKAQQLLLTPGHTVADVADELGYGSTAAFSRSFERICGASPSAYRNAPQAYPRIHVPYVFDG